MISKTIGFRGLANIFRHTQNTARWIQIAIVLSHCHWGPIHGELIPPPCSDDDCGHDTDHAEDPQQTHVILYHMQWDVSQVQDETTSSASINKTSTGFCHDTTNLWESHNMPKPYSRCITVSSVSMSDPWQPWPSTQHHPESRGHHDGLELAVWLHGHHS